MPIAKIDDQRIHFEVVGTGDPVILLMPQSSGPRGVSEFVNGLAHNNQLIHYDQRGTGSSDRAPDSITMRSLANEVEAVVDALDLESISLLCHSTGCGIGTLIAATQPERIDKLILISPWTHADQHLHAMQTLRQNAVGLLDAEQYARFNASILFPPQYRRQHAQGFADLAQTAVPAAADDFRRRLDAILAFDAREYYGDIKSPTLVISAADDQLMPAWFGAEAASSIEQSSYRELESGGHMLPETRTEAVVEAISSFL